MIYLPIVVYSLIAGFIGWIWIDFYRLLGLYGNKNLIYIILTFLLGAASVILVGVIDDAFIDHIIPGLSQDLFDNISFFVFRVGLVEETAKSIPFIIIFLIFRSQFKEPMDYIMFFSVSALGFSATENVLYFLKLTNGIIVVRAILSSVSHMFFSVLIAYGIVLVKFKKVNNKFSVIATCFLIAFVSHGMFDFIIESGGGFGLLMSMIFFFLTVSAFASIINNSLNNAINFSYKMVNTDKTITRILLYYAILFIIQFVINTIQKNGMYAFSFFMSSLFTVGFIIWVVVIRLSRIKLIQGRWDPVKIELPFHGATDFDGAATRMGFRVRGESGTEATLNKYYEEYISINPLSKSSIFGKPKIAYIEKRLFLENDVAFQQTKVFTDEKKEDFKLFLLKSKTKDKVMYQDKYPIAGVYLITDPNKINDPSLSFKDLKFVEWVFVKPYKISN